MINFFSPFEQFTVFPLINFKFFSTFFGFVDFSITNQASVILFLVLIIYFFLLSIFKPKTSSLYMIPTYPQYCIEYWYFKAERHFRTILKDDVDQYLNALIALFIYILGLNLLGMIPFSFSVTSQPSTTLCLAFLIYLSPAREVVVVVVFI